MTAISDLGAQPPAILATGTRPEPADASPGSASCWLCSTRQRTVLMVADGGPACENVRWYCRAVDRCTARWTEHGAILPS
jgi:hypothetical protein